jgi:hypothetical protein
LIYVDNPLAITFRFSPEGSLKVCKSNILSAMEAPGFSPVKSGTKAEMASATGQGYKAHSLMARFRHG